MTPKGRAFIIARLSACPSKEKLRLLWEDCLGGDAKRDPEIRAFAAELAKSLPEKVKERRHPE